MKTTWVEKYRARGEEALAAGYVREVDFSGSTYQIEVFDPDLDETLWPFFQFNGRGQLIDAFCSCPTEGEGCHHLAAGYLKIFGAQLTPLHTRFDRSIWSVLSHLYADDSGYEDNALKRSAEGRYIYKGKLLVEMEGSHLAMLLENRVKETPENSLKFSNLNQEEIDRWKEGRPTPELRYLLSFWFDLAKWLMSFEREAELIFDEDEAGLPTRLTIAFKGFSSHWTLTREALEMIIPTLGTLNSSLKLFSAAADKLEAVSYDPEERCFHLVHGEDEEQRIGVAIGGWIYIAGEGFIPAVKGSAIGKAKITEEEIPDFLDRFSERIHPFIPIATTYTPVHYTMHFDDDWNWHFSGYLFEKGDLNKEQAAFFGRWAYLPEKGFFSIKEPLFDHSEIQLSPEHVSHFINHHRIWLNSQEGYQTHLASIDSHLSYSMTDQQVLRIHTFAQAEGGDTKDFGDWIYYDQLGFFSKKHARLGGAVRPGVEVRSMRLAKFIRDNSEELESIPDFFTTHLPFTQRGLTVTIRSPTTVNVKPFYKGAVGVQFFEEYAYLKGVGFCEIPHEMRLPVAFQEPCIINQADLPSFLLETLPKLERFIPDLDSRLKQPHKLDIQVDYLVRTPVGGLKAELYFVTEQGRVPASQLLGAYEKKQRFLFSEAGLLDLRDETFQWVRELKRPVASQEESVELTTLEFLRLDTTYNLLMPPAIEPMADITNRLLRELRSFTAHESTDLRGLRSELRLYQQTGLKWLWFLYKNSLSALLCDDMGLGKTHQAMALIAATLNQKDALKRRYLVVCPTSVIYHWQDKLEQFLPGVKVSTFHGLKRSLKNLPKEGIILTTYGIVRSEEKALKKLSFDVAIFDEIQVAKNVSSRVHQALLNLNARTCVGLTGTPIENNLRELKALFDIVLPGYMPGETRFRELFINPIERDFDEEKKALLTQLIRPFVMRRRKSEVLQELPEKSEDCSYCELTDEQIGLYQETLAQQRERMISDLRDVDAKVNYIHIFSLLSRLKQICNHPALVHKDPQHFKNYTSGKWELFTELLQEAHESGQKVVVFSQYLTMLDIIEYHLKEKRWEYAQIRGDTVDRRTELKRFQEDPNCTVFIGSLQAAGLGIDLTSASVVIMYDRWWNAARENQAIDRVHRMGQKRGVQVYKLISKGTIEEKIDKMIFRKGQLLEEVVESDDQTVLKKFSRADLIDLLSYTGTKNKDL